MLEGELSDADTVEVQVWRYNPLVAGLGAVDPVSLGASLMELGDERVSLELDALFGEEDLWLWTTCTVDSWHGEPLKLTRVVDLKLDPKKIK